MLQLAISLALLVGIGLAAYRFRGQMHQAWYRWLIFGASIVMGITAITDRQHRSMSGIMTIIGLSYLLRSRDDPRKGANRH